MIWVYIASAIFGFAFLIPMVLGGLDFGDDVDFDFDTDTDLDVDMGDIDMAEAVGVDMDVDGGMVEAVGDFVSSLLSFRSFVFATAFFGLAGLALSALGTDLALTLVVSIALGLVAAMGNAALMEYVLGSENSSHLTNSDMRGASAEVVLPISSDRKGRIRAQIAGQTEYFVALPFKAGTEFNPGDPVVVVEIDNGTALISPLPSLEA